MKILLVNPAFTNVYGKFRAAARVGVLYPPTGLTYLASNIEGGHDVRILDLEIDPEFDTALETFKPDMVGITFVTPLFTQAMELFRRTKRFDEKIWTIAGGPHPSTLPDSVAANENVDTVLPGEGEVSINKFLQNPSQGVLPREPLVGELDRIAFPARKLLENEKYVWSIPGKGIQPMASLLTTRGCPYPCTFCSQHILFGRSVRYRSADNIVNEIRLVGEEYGINHFSVLDDTLGLNRQKTYELCEAIKKSGLKITFEGYTRANVVTKDLLEKLKEVGLNRLSFGIESGDEDILKAVKKGITLDQIREAYRLANEVGLETRGSIIFGLPFETKETIKKTIEFVKSLKCDQMYVNVGTPFPGTEYHEQAEKGYGGLELLTKDWQEYRRWGNAVLDVNELTAEDLVRWQRRALLAFYLRPKQIYYNLKRAGGKAAIKNVWSFVKSFVG